MKLRFHNDTVRIRLSRSEVALLAGGGRVEQMTTFSSTTRLISSIVPSAEVQAIQVVFDGERLTVRMPTIDAVRWAESQDVGIDAEQAVDQDHALHILIEKDFECLHGDVSENEDAFPNPLAEQSQ